MSKVEAIHIQIEGIVQGVGFRPFVYSLAKQFELDGWVRNTSGGVEVTVVGEKESLVNFLRKLSTDAPPLSRIDQIDIKEVEPDSYQSFKILSSKTFPDAFQPVSPDMSICDQCLEELFTPTNRRYLYPFINCTNCGPRFTIIKDLPYDRPHTTMSGFKMCPDCLKEYQDPLDRRFHAQPIACPACGPIPWLVEINSTFSNQNILDKISFPPNSELVSLSSILQAQQLLLNGKIVAIKGLGGFHLACDAFNHNSVTNLRKKKKRSEKPFAVMVGDLETIYSNCFISEFERSIIESRQRPVVILEKRPDSQISKAVAPNQNTIGVMLPYTPLHYLLFRNLKENSEKTPVPIALVMTSGNTSEEPIVIENNESIEKLANIADAFLLHDRPIHTRCDDSVYRVFPFPVGPVANLHSKRDYFASPLRRSRGYAPDPLILPFPAKSILATGADLKNTFCFAKNKYAVISHHIGDLENFETLRSFEESIELFEKLFKITPEIIAYDLHPGYFSSNYALDRSNRDGINRIGIQHHHAHIASCMADNGLDGSQKVIGISFDGTGYGTDSSVWGGEILLSDYNEFKRLGHIKYVPLPGGDLAIHEPWRMALSWLQSAEIEWNEKLFPVNYALSIQKNEISVLDVLNHQIETGFNAPLTSSAGRLFDAVSALVGIRQTVTYEAQAAIELEALIDPKELEFYQIAIDHEIDSNINNFHPLIINPSPMFHEIVKDITKGVHISKISARFHNGLSRAVATACCRIRDLLSCNMVVLSGGVWQNSSLLLKTSDLLSKDNFEILYHKQLPTNDGGISLGQAVIAAKQYAD